MLICAGVWSLPYWNGLDAFAVPLWSQIANSRVLPFAVAMRASGRYVRIEVEGARDRDRRAEMQAIDALPGVLLVEALPPDMEATLRHLASAA